MSTAWLNSKNSDTRLGLGNFVKESGTGILSSLMNDNWLRLDILFESKDFQVEMRNISAFEASDIKNLMNGLAEIDKNSTGKASLSSHEPYLAFEIDINAAGSGFVKGEIWNLNSENSNKLLFQFDTDQSCVRKFYGELKGMV